MSDRDRSRGDRAGADAGAPARSSGGRGAPGKTTRTQRLPPARARRDVDDGGGAPVAPEDSTSSGNRLRANPDRLIMPEARAGASSTRSFRLENPGTQPVEIFDVIPQRQPAEIVSTGIDSTMLDGGASTAVHLTFTPSAAVKYVDTLIAETGEGPDVGIRVSGRGKASLPDGLAAHDPSATADLAQAQEDDRAAEARQHAHRGSAPSLETYAELHTAFAQALEYGRQELWPEAAVLAEAVGDRMRVLTHPQRVLELVRRHHLGQQALEVELAMCRDAVFAVEQRTQARLALAGADYLRAFEQAAVDLRVLTGESDDVSHLRAFDRATMVTAELYAVPLVVVGTMATGGLLLEASPVIVSEISLLGAGARALFLGIATWINTHPEEAEAWGEVAISVGVDAGEDPHGFYQRLQTPEGWFQLATNVFMTVYPARTGRGGGEPEPSEPTAGRPSGHVEAGDPASSGPRASGGRAAEPAVDQAADRTLERLEHFVTASREREQVRATPSSAAPRPATAGTAEPAAAAAAHEPAATADAASPAAPSRGAVGAVARPRASPAGADAAHGEDVTVESTGAITASVGDEVRGTFDVHPVSTLTARQREIAAKLPNQGDMSKFHKREVSMNDLRAIGRVTGDEYSMYTLGARRLVIRGVGNKVQVPDQAFADALKAGKYGKWSGHNHPPGYMNDPGPADRPNIPDGQSRSAIWGDEGPAVFFRDPAAEAEYRRAMFARLYGEE